MTTQFYNNGQKAPDAVTSLSDLEAGQKAGKFVIQKKIGEGGFGAVYKAVNDIDKVGAVKVLHPQFSADPGMVSRFKAEARAVNQIGHRGIIDIFEFGVLPDGRHYYVMEHLDGVPLDEFLKQKGRLSLEEALPFLASIARALDAAHAKGVAHRDLKPENVFLTHNASGEVEEAKLLDFGIAKLLHNDDSFHKTQTGAPMGTPYYMSPEQCRGRDVDHRTDVYAFGVLTYQLLTGMMPFNGEDYMEIMMAQIHQEPKAPSEFATDISVDADMAVLWMLRKDPADRPPTLIEAIQALVGEGEIPESISAEFAFAHSETLAIPFAEQKSRKSTIGAGTKAQLQVEKKKPLPLIAAAVAVLGLGAVFFVSRGGFSEGETQLPPKPNTQAVQPASLNEPLEKTAAPTATPTLVTVDIQGAPEGAKVSWANGVLGVAPGKVQMPYGTKPVILTFELEGYRLATAEVVPNQDAALKVPMFAIETKPRRPRKKTKKRKSRNSIENPF